MKKINFAWLFIGLTLLTSSAFAESLFKSKDDVQGMWKLDHTKKSATSTEIIKREDTWNFNNGTVTITHIPRDGSYYDQQPVNYEIEDGKLKISMTLKGKYGDIYVFNKK